MVGVARASGGHPLWHILLVLGSPVAMWVALELFHWVAHAHTRSGVRQRLPRSGLVVLSAAACAGSGAVHAVVCPEHFHEAFAFGVFFGLVSAAQVGAASILVFRPTRRVLTGVAIGNLAMVAVWAVSRTVGVPIGPGPWRPESIGTADRLAVVLEMLVVACSAWVLHSGAAPATTPAV